MYFSAEKDQLPCYSMEMYSETLVVPFVCEPTDYGSFLSSIQIHGPEKHSSITTMVIFGYFR